MCLQSCGKQEAKAAAPCMSVEEATQVISFLLSLLLFPSFLFSFFVVLFFSYYHMLITKSSMFSVFVVDAGRLGKKVKPFLCGCGCVCGVSVSVCVCVCVCDCIV